MPRTYVFQEGSVSFPIILRVSFYGPKESGPIWARAPKRENKDDLLQILIGFPVMCVFAAFCCFVFVEGERTEMVCLPGGFTCLISREKCRLTMAATHRRVFLNFVRSRRFWNVLFLRMFRLLQTVIFSECQRIELIDLI